MDSLRKSSPAHPLPVPDAEAGYDTPASPASDAYPASLPRPKTPRRARRRRILFLAAGAVVLVILGSASFLMYKSLSVGRNIQIQNDARPSLFSDMKRLAAALLQEKSPRLRGEETGRINILLLGRAGEHYPGKNLTDTVMLMSIDTVGKKVALLSLPRDLYAPIAGTDFYTKLNSLYQYGLNQGEGIAPLRASVEDITGQRIDYFFILDFDGFEKAVDALGAIQVDVPRDILDTRYPGKNYSYETFEIKKGWQTLDGKTALKYVRERHDDPEGDFGRAKRQQQVIEAIKDKAFSLGTFFNIFTVNALLNALGESVKTDMALDDMEGLLRLAKTLDTKNVSSVVVDAWKKESLLRVSHIQVGSIRAFVLVPRVGNWSEIRDISDNIFHLDAIRARRGRIAAEEPALTILYAPESIAIAQKMKRLVTEEMGFSQVSSIPLGALENQPERSMIVHRSALAKPFSLDELLKKFPLQQKDTLPFSLAARAASDFIIVIGDDLADALAFDENTADTVVDDSAFSEVLPPQPKPEKKH